MSRTPHPRTRTMGLAKRLALASILVWPVLPPAESAPKAAIVNSLNQAVFRLSTDDAPAGLRPELMNILKEDRKRLPEEYAAAAYLLGRIAHREHQLSGANSLGEAIDYYRKCHSASRKEARSTFHAEARLYKALAQLEKGELVEARQAVEDMSPALDRTVQIDYLVWSSNKNSAINASFPTDEIRAETLRLLQLHKDPPPVAERAQSNEQNTQLTYGKSAWPQERYRRVVRDLTFWCLQAKSTPVQKQPR